MGRILRDQVVRYIENNPGCTCASMASAFGTYNDLVKAHLARLRTSGKVKTEKGTIRNSWGCRSQIVYYYPLSDARSSDG